MTETREFLKLELKRLCEEDEEFYIVARRLHWKCVKGPIIQEHWNELEQKYPQLKNCYCTAIDTRWNPLTTPLSELFF